MSRYRDPQLQVTENLCYFWSLSPIIYQFFKIEGKFYCETLLIRVIQLLIKTQNVHCSRNQYLNSKGCPSKSWSDSLSAVSWAILDVRIYNKPIQIDYGDIITLRQTRNENPWRRRFDSTALKGFIVKYLTLFILVTDIWTRKYVTFAYRLNFALDLGLKVIEF